MKVGILTSSRADFGIYLPLLNALKSDDFFNLEIIAFGTHLSSSHGLTINQIVSSGFDVSYKIDSMMLSDTPEAIATAIGLTMIKFASFWEIHHEEFDVVFCLGDRYEMFAAVMAGIPFEIKFAHLHGGEKTLGAIDNVFRHCVSHASKLHFASTEAYADRLTKLLDENQMIYNVGALSLDNLTQLKLLDVEEFKEKWGLSLKKKTILVTFHPETVGSGRNEYYAKELIAVIKLKNEYQYLITMPNADTSGNVIRQLFKEELGTLENVFLIENLGIQSYFTAMKYCTFLLGNTSSGIIEAASFKKYVINLGSRQKGRACGENVLQTEIKIDSILSSICQVEQLGDFLGDNIYFSENVAFKIIGELKEHFRLNY